MRSRRLCPVYEYFGLTIAREAAGMISVGALMVGLGFGLHHFVPRLMTDTSGAQDLQMNQVQRSSGQIHLGAASDDAFIA